MKQDNRLNWGKLYVVATPIGNLRDVTLRALDVLRGVARIATEDTRHSQKLLQHYHIQTPVISLHRFNEKQRLSQLLAYLKAGQDIALISDSGTPLVCDPGYLLIKALSQAGILVHPIPGACAAITALCASGFSGDQFLFAGFLPAKTQARQTYLQKLSRLPYPVIFYEAPHRIVRCACDMLAILGAGRHIVLAKELSKTFETFIKGSAQVVLDWLKADPVHTKGEFVVIISPFVMPKTLEVSEKSAAILACLQKELPMQKALFLAAKITGESKNKLKAMAFGTKGT